MLTTVAEEKRFEVHPSAGGNRTADKVYARGGDDKLEVRRRARFRETNRFNWYLTWNIIPAPPSAEVVKFLASAT